MAIRDLITSDPYYQNLVNPRGFPTGNDPYVAPTFDDPVQIQPEYGLQSIINPYLPQNQGSDNQPPFDPILQQLIRGERPENAPGMKTANNTFYENENSIAPNQNTNYDDIDMSYNNESFNIQPQQGILQGLQDKIGAGFNNVKDFAMNKGNMGKKFLGSAGAMAMGLPGIVGSGAMSLLGGLGNMFEDRQLSGDGTTVDEYGNSYNASDLNKMNAKGGYYTEAARSSRRRTNRINKMLARKAKGKRISAANLARLQAQEAAQEAARQAATTQMAAANRASGTGGYQAGYGSGFMDGPSGAGRGMGAADKGGSDSMGSFRDGGLASMFTRRR